MEWGAIVEVRGTEGKEVLSGARDGFAEYFDLEVAARGVKGDRHCRGRPAYQTCLE